MTTENDECEECTSVKALLSSVEVLLSEKRRENNANGRDKKQERVQLSERGVESVPKARFHFSLQEEKAEPRKVKHGPQRDDGVAEALPSHYLGTAPQTIVPLS